MSEHTLEAVPAWGLEHLHYLGLLEDSMRELERRVAELEEWAEIHAASLLANPGEHKHEAPPSH